MKSALILVLTLLTLLTFGTAAPDLSTTTAVIPYTELKALLAAQHPSEKTPEPPVPWAISQIKIRPTPADGHTTLHVTITGLTLARGYHFIPILDGNVSLAEADTTNCQPFHQPSGLNLLTEKPGPFSADLVLQAPDLTSPGSNFTLKNTQDFPFNVTLPDAPPFPLSATTSATKALTIRHSSAAETAAPEALVPTTWSALTHVAITPGADALHCTARIQLYGDKGSGASSTLSLPPNARSAAPSAEGLVTAVPLRNAEGQQTLTLEWDDAQILDRTLLLTYRLPLPTSLAEPWILEAPTAAGEDTITFTLGTPPELSIAAEGSAPTSPLTLRAPWLLHALGETLAHAISLPAGAKSRIEVSPSWAARIETQSATIPLAKFSTRVVTGGSTLTSATISVAHESTWTLGLDKLLTPGSRLISCEIDSKKATPIRNGESGLLLHLPAPEKPGSPSTVTFAFSSSTTPFDPVSGRLDLALPATPTLIETIDWEITLPTGYEPTAVQGNLTFSETANSKSALHLQKSLTRDQQPATEIYYQRQGLSN